MALSPREIVPFPLKIAEHSHFGLIFKILLSCGKHLVLSVNELLQLSGWVINVSQCNLFESL